MRCKIARFLTRSHTQFWAVALLLVFLASRCVRLYSNVKPEATSIEYLKIGIPEARKAQIFAGWNAVLNSGDLSMVIGALDVLEFAPPELKSAIIEESQNSTALRDLFQNVSQERRDQLLKALFRYPELAVSLQPLFASELASSKLDRSQLQYLTDIILLVNAQPALDAKLKNQLLIAEHDASDPQVRQTLASALVDHAASLKDSEPQIRAMFKSSRTDEQQLGLLLLLRLHADVPVDSVKKAIDDQQRLQDDAIDYLEHQMQALDNDEIKTLLSFLFQSRSAVTWEASYRALAANGACAGERKIRG